MFVVENVILTEAVIACTAGAIAELQVRIGGIGAAADRALVPITLLGLLLALLLGGSLELNGLVRNGQREDESAWSKTLGNS